MEDYPEPARKSRGPAILNGRAIYIAAFIYLLAGTAVYVSIDNHTLQIARDLSGRVVALLLLLSLVNYGVRAWRWVALSKHLAIGVPVTRNIIYYLAGYSLTASPAKAGEIVRLWFLKAGNNIPYTRSISLLLADRVVDIWVILILVSISVSGFADYRVEGVLAALMVILVSIPILFPRQFLPILLWIMQYVPRSDRAIDRSRRVVQSMEELVSWRTYGVTLIPSIIGWFSECVALFILLESFGANVTLMSAVFVFSFSIIVGALSMLPGGLGSTEVVIVILLRSLDVDFDTALAVTAIIRLTTFWFAVAIGVACMPLAIKAVREKAIGL